MAHIRMTQQNKTNILFMMMSLYNYNAMGCKKIQEILSFTVHSL
jgi:hypothetical protein